MLPGRHINHFSLTRIGQSNNSSNQTTITKTLEKTQILKLKLKFSNLAPSAIRSWACALSYMQEMDHVGCMEVKCRLMIFFIPWPRLWGMDKLFQFILVIQEKVHSFNLSQVPYFTRYLYLYLLNTSSDIRTILD